MRHFVQVEHSAYSIRPQDFSQRPFTRQRVNHATALRVNLSPEAWFKFVPRPALAAPRRTINRTVRLRMSRRMATGARKAVAISASSKNAPRQDCRKPAPRKLRRTFRMRSPRARPRICQNASVNRTIPAGTSGVVGSTAASRQQNRACQIRSHHEQVYCSAHERQYGLYQVSHRGANTALRGFGFWATWPSSTMRFGKSKFLLRVKGNRCL